MLKLLGIDRFIILLVLAVGLASIFPVSGLYAHYFDDLTTLAITLLFFLHGVKISRRSMLEGLMHWKLHGLIFSFTFVLFPSLGLMVKPIILPLLGQELYWGFLFLCFLPSTVQSSIAFTSIANGNVAGAVCSASLSNIVGMIITPVLVSLFIMQQQHHDIHMIDSIKKIVLALFIPFALGQMTQTWFSPFLKKYPKLVKGFDQGSILMVVYSAFSSAVISGIWQQVNGLTLMWIVLISCAFLMVIMLLSLFLAKRLKFSLEDQKAIFFCASKKTLASGVPMAKILFVGQPLGLIILPIMIFHQIQLMVCGIIANYWSHQK